MKIIDLAVVLEALVLFDRPVMRLLSDLPLTFATEDPVLAPFIDAGILKIERYENPEVSRLLRVGDDERAASAMRYNLHVSIEHTLAAGQTNSRYVGPSTVLPAECERLILAAIAELNRDIQAGTTGATLEQLASYMTALPVIRAIGSIANATDSLLKVYSAWMEGAKSELQTLESWGKPIPLIVPPIAAIVFEQSRNLDSLGRVALSLRDDLEGHRNAIRSYSSTIRQEDIPLADAITAARRLQAATASLTRTTSSPGILTFVNFPELIAAGGSFLGGPAHGTIGVAKALLGRPLEWILDRLRRRDAMFISAIDQRFHQIRNYSSNIERLLGHSIADTEYDTARRWLADMQTWTLPSE